MLLELSIRNIALIEKLCVPFAPGLNVLTGETGAGKSIVVDSVNLALGARGSREMVRTGAETASVQALFALPKGSPVPALLLELGIDLDGDLLIIGRELTAGGRSICRINGEVVPLARFKQITSLLVDVHGQHEHQALLRQPMHLEYLDAYGDAHHRELMVQVSEAYEAYAHTGREIEQLSLSALERERKMDMLSFQIGEIDAVKPKAGEDEQLEQRLNLLRNAEKIAFGLGQAYALVYRGEGRAISAQDALKRAADGLSPLRGIDERFEKLAARIEELYYQAQDIGYELGDMQGEIEYDPALIEKLDDRLNDLKRLKRKYGPELGNVIDYMTQIKAELADIGAGDEHVLELKEKQAKQRAALSERCAKLTASRKTLADGFSKNLLAQLKDLGMGKTRFEVGFEPVQFAPSGADRVEFLISPNPGEPLKPLAEIASGGELARIMLAMKAISADTAGVDTMIFDEIDTGVSGRMAQVVGEKMAEVAVGRQVICVTHLPQIAALAGAHYLVEKQVQDGRTGTGVRLLDRDGRISELARILSGAGDADSRQYAAQMLDAAQKLVGGA